MHYITIFLYATSLLACFLGMQLRVVPAISLACGRLWQNKIENPLAMLSLVLNYSWNGNAETTRPCWIEGTTLPPASADVAEREIVKKNPCTCRFFVASCCRTCGRVSWTNNRETCELLCLPVSSRIIELLPHFVAVGADLSHCVRKDTAWK